MSIYDLGDNGIIRNSTIAGNLSGGAYLSGANVGSTNPGLPAAGFKFPVSVRFPELNSSWLMASCPESFIACGASSTFYFSLCHRIANCSNSLESLRFNFSLMRAR